VSASSPHSLEHEVTERLLPPPVTERSQDASSPAISPKGNDLWAAWNRCPICEGIDQPGLLHNPEAPYCSEADPAKERIVSDSSPPLSEAVADIREFADQVRSALPKSALRLDTCLDSLEEQLQTLQGADREWATENEALAIDLNAEHVKVFELQEQLETAQRLIDQAAVLLHNSTSPRHARWHDDFDQWLANVRASFPASRQDV